MHKLKMHYQFSAEQNNYIAFCSVPIDSLLPLTIRRDPENSCYTVYDKDSGHKVMKIERSIGGTFKFCAFHNGKNWKQIAKMKSNFIGTEFHCYVYKINENGEVGKEKYQSISIKYEVNILGLSGPRKIKVYTVNKPIMLDFNLMELC